MWRLFLKECGPAVECVYEGVYCSILQSLSIWVSGCQRHRLKQDSFHPESLKSSVWGTSRGPGRSWWVHLRTPHGDQQSQQRNRPQGSTTGPGTRFGLQGHLTWPINQYTNHCNSCCQYFTTQHDATNTRMFYCYYGTSTSTVWTLKNCDFNDTQKP